MIILEQFRHRQQTQELFLWAHFALLALLPLALVLTMAGLAVGEPLLPGWMEMPVLAIPIISYLVWQQWHRPFYPFSLGFVHRSVAELSTRQKQILTIVKRPATGWIAVVVGVFMYAFFRQIYIVAPLASDIAPFPSGLRFLGIVWSLVFFFIANVCAQLAVVAMRIFTLPETELQEEYDQTKIKQDFTLLGAERGNLWRFDRESQPSTAIEQKEAKSPISSQPTPPTTENTEENEPDAPSPSPETPEVESKESDSGMDSPETVVVESQEKSQPEEKGMQSPEEITLPDIPDLVFTTEEQKNEES